MKKIIGLTFAMLAIFSSCRQMWNTEAAHPEKEAMVEVVKNTEETLDAPERDQANTELIPVPKLSELLMSYLTGLE